MKTLRCPGPLSRRDFLKFGAAALGGLGVSNLPALRSQAKAAGESSGFIRHTGC